jgi:ribosome biogenesis ATPase
MPNNNRRQWLGSVGNRRFLEFVENWKRKTSDDGVECLDKLVVELSETFAGFRRLPRRSQYHAATEALLHASLRSATPAPEDSVSDLRNSGTEPKGQSLVSRTEEGKDVFLCEKGAATAAKRTRYNIPSRAPVPPQLSHSKSSFLTSRPNQRFSDVGGIENAIELIRELVEWPLRHVQLYTHLGVDPPRGILLHGPSGCGKTLLANAVAGELGVPFLKISAPELVAGLSGESEQRVRALFEEAKYLAPSLIFIDEIDAITSRRDTSNREMLHRILAQLLTCLDSISLDLTENRPIVVIGATNRPEALDPALRRAGRFDREIELGAPDEEAREKILCSVTRRMRLSRDFIFKNIARRTAGYVGADLAALATEAAAAAIRRIGHEIPADSLAATNVAELDTTQLDMLFVSMDDFAVALGRVQPSALREGFSTVPDVSWDDVGALDDLRKELENAVIEPLREPEKYARFGIGISAGVLLYGPPGCGKTLLAKAVANESGANFICVKGPELLDKYVGESERAVRRLFQRARASAPCVIFFDELDALAPRRAYGGYSVSTGSENDAIGSNASERLVNQLLTELDGIHPRKQVFVIGATNRPDLIDAAMLRPGRFDKLLYVPLPDEVGRRSILEAATRKVPLDPLANLDCVAAATQGFSGADLTALVREAAVWALRSNAPTITEENFQAALRNVLPSVSPRDAALYSSMQQNLRRARGHVRENIVS